MPALIIVGAGGLGREVLWTARRSDTIARMHFDRIGFCDDDSALTGRQVDEVEILGPIESCGFGPETLFCCAIGGNRVRREVVIRAERLGWIPLTVVDPTATVAATVRIEPGAYVAAHAILSPGSAVGRHVIVNQAASLGHDGIADEFSQLCPGVRVLGASKLRDGALVGSNAVVREGVEIGAWAVVGAGSFVVRDVEPGVTVIGNPARRIMASR